jgi:Rieske Fe-S protein
LATRSGACPPPSSRPPLSAESCKPILRDLVLGRENAWASAYEPNRISVKAAGEYVSENVTMPANLAEHVTGGELSSSDELKPGQGALIRRGAKKLAAYRDDGGALHLRSATCTHAGCVIHWMLSSNVGTAPVTARSSRWTANL